jgi:hypothetical protein
LRNVRAFGAPKICNAIREIDRHGIGRARRTGSAWAATRCICEDF